MFYCNEDASEKGWPITLFQSYGRCAVCGQSRVCNNLRAEDLPESESAPVRTEAGHEAPTHRCPPPGSGVMPCCDRSPFEVPRTHRMTVDDALVTCRLGTPEADR